MAISLDPPDEQPDRIPGDFYRSASGTPYVSDPTGELVKSGPRKGQPKRLAYGRPSSFGGQIDSGFALTKYCERVVLVGAAIETSIVLQARNLLGRDRDDKAWKEEADGLVLAAKSAADHDLAAQRGTHGHAITEDDDAGRDWIDKAERGEVLGLPRDVQSALVDAWRQMLVDNGLTLMAFEMAVVHDGYRMAGTLDRIAELSRPLRFTLVTGEMVEIPARSYVVLDIKTGRRRQQLNGVVMYWQKYAVQIHTYAAGVPYDTELEQRGEWPWPIEQRWGLIAHLDVLGALAGEPSCELVLVDLEAGRHAAELCLAAKAWEKRTDVFSIAQIAADVQHDAEQPATSAHPLADVAPPEGGPPPSGEERRLPRLRDIDEGDLLEQANFAVLNQHFGRLDPDDKAWVWSIIEQARDYGLSIHAGDSGLRTVRRFELVRGLLHLAEGDWYDDTIVRELAATAAADTSLLYPVFTAGAVVGALDADEAKRFAELCVAVGHNPASTDLITATTAG